jgi:hypothetical protein
LPDVSRDDGFDPDRWDAAFIIARDGSREFEPGTYRRTIASLNNGWLARGGHLALHDDCLSFSPTPFERILFARKFTIPFDEITRVERQPTNPGEALPGGKAPRMRLLCGARTFEFVFFNGLDDWIESLKDRLEIWAHRTRFASADA